MLPLLAHQHALTSAHSAILHDSQGAVLHINFHRDVKACSVHPPAFSILFPTDRTDFELKQMTRFFPTPDHFLPTGGAIAGSLSSSCLAQARFALPIILPAKRELLLLSARTVGERCAGVAADSDMLSLPSSTKGIQLQAWLGPTGERKSVGKQN